MIGASEHTLPAIGLALLEKLPKMFPARSAYYCKLGEQLKAEIKDLLGDRGVLLFPPYSTPAPKHIKPLLPPINYCYTCIWNVMETPVTQGDTFVVNFLLLFCCMSW
jgi:fatty acid amide hydrolase 2